MTREKGQAPPLTEKSSAPYNESTPVCTPSQTEPTASHKHDHHGSKLTTTRRKEHPSSVKPDTLVRAPYQRFKACTALKGKTIFETIIEESACQSEEDMMMSTKRTLWASLEDFIESQEKLGTVTELQYNLDRDGHANGLFRQFSAH